jgi:hypothetical protein
MHQRKDLQQGDGHHCGAALWSRLYKNHAPAASPEGENAGAWGWGPETAVPPGKAQVVRTLPYLA